MNKYSRQRQIGEGAFGKAVLVKKKDSAKQYVIKEINIMKMSPKERDEARKEVAVLAQLKHPNIVAYVESFEEKGTLYIVMNYCAGGDLYGKINERRGQLFSEDQILDWFVQLCLAIKHIHDRKILHRDIKSQNIFLTHTGTVQLGDFGIAKVLNSTAQLAHTCIGTPYYLSPEIVENMPYNNKSDIWSMGCVLYELTTLKHAFEASNMKNLVLKIIRGSYPPVPPQFSYDLRGLIAQLFKRNPRDRPTVNSILRKNFIMQRVRRLLSAEDLQDEFSHTVMHGHKIAKALPPAPKPSADPIKKPAPSPRPGSAGKKYDPAAVYGAPLNSSRNRLSGEKKRPSTPGRAVPIPGQMDWEKKKKEKLDQDERRKAEMRKREQEANERKHREFIERQKMARINKAREEGWKQVVDPFYIEENRPVTPKNDFAKPPRPLPVPKVNNDNRDRGNYEAYNQFLNKLHQDRQTPSPGPARNPNHVDVVHMAVPRPVPQQRPQFNMGPLGIPAVVDQAGRDRQLGAQAAERARVVEDYMQRQRMAAMNKMRAQNDLYGAYRPSSADRRTPVPAPQRGGSPKNDKGRGGGGGGGGGVMVARNREEQEYLEKLRQIRIQNMRDRRAIRGVNVAEGASKNSEEAEERKKKVEALKQQAEQWAEMKKKELEQQRQGIVPVKPSTPAVPMTGALQAIGAINVANKPSVGQAEEKPAVPLTNALQAIAAETERPKSSQQVKKDNILKKLNDKNPSRGKWGPPASPAVTEEEERRKWGPPASPVVEPATQGEEDSSRSHWGGGKNLHLSQVPLEMTGSKMEATTPRDQVIRLTEEDKDAQRGRWKRKSDVVKALDNMPICPDTVVLSDPSQVTNQDPPVGVGATITITPNAPSQGATITITEPAADKPKTGRPLPMPHRSGTIILSKEMTGRNVPVIDEDHRTSTEVKKDEMDGKDNSKLKDDLTASSAEGQGQVTAKTVQFKDREGAKSVQLNLTSGNFDLKNVKLLRTISEPDLTNLANMDMEIDPGKHATLRRHHSLDMTVVPENEGSDDGEDDDFEEEDIPNFDNDEETGQDEDDDEDIKSMMETLQSIIDSDDEDKEKTKVSIQISEAGDMTDACRPAKDNSENVSDEDNCDAEREKLEEALALGSDDSDDDTTFGDDDEEKDNDRFGRVEQLRAELESDIGLEKLVQVYEIIKKMQEDDSGTLGQGSNIAIEILGPSKEQLFPKIFQLVMADIAFNEDN
ncbi:serine/threonine-protein kinase Nek1-like [Physella acuta]|uniref:serine/threonine-protein kinase Nek1-like n=1 Tax=Physella acuta TaxID=109671 RepID=UPI0027DD0017|nr:serine/threonine-protein kinase Nek1-like [Physella acuta]